MKLTHLLPGIAIAVTMITSSACAASGDYRLLWGNQHSHTSLSDGKGTPQEAFDMARHDAKLDFWIISDHAEQIDIPIPGSATKTPKWEILKAAAAEKNAPGAFLAIASYEWSADQSQGHMNVHDTPVLARFGETYTLARFQKWLRKHPEAITGFNHPPESPKIFNDLEYIPDLASQTVYIAVNQKSDLQYYFKALDNGWHIAPVADQDNHEKNWGSHPNNNFLAVYSTDITYPAFMEALANRRFYAANTRSIRLWIEGNRLPMGTRLLGDTAEILISVSDSSGARINSLKLYSNNSTIIKEWTPDSSDFQVLTSVTRTAASSWFVAVVETDKDRYAISAPIRLSPINR